MKIGFKTSQTSVDWPTLLATWEAGDQMPVFDSAWIFDHYVALGAAGGGSHEAFVTLAALAARTNRLQLGHLVLGNTYRQPALVANSGVSMDHISNGRFVLGLGAGWHEEEHAMYGLTLPPIGERITMLESAVRVIKALWRSPQGVSLEAPPYHLVDAVCDPPPLTAGGPPIWLGTQGMRRGLRIVAEYADGWNHTGDPQTFTEKRDALLRHCDAVGRNPDEIEISAQAFLGDSHEALLGVASGFAREGAQHVILVMPASSGPDGLARLAREVAEPLREQFG